MNHRFVVAQAESSQVISASNPPAPLEWTDHQSQPLETPGILRGRKSDRYV